MPFAFLRHRLALLCALTLAVACGEGVNPAELSPEELGSQSSAAVTVPARGTANTLDFGTWNIEWFGSTSNGPTNETLQLENARDIIKGTDLDIWGLAEIVDTAHFNNLVSQLPGYAGLLANHSSVVNGSAYYSSTEQKVGIVYKTSIATVQSAKIILTNYDYDFAGRPPLEVKLSVSLGGVTSDLIFIVFHAKAFNDDTSWQRRLNASNALKSYLDSTYPTQRVIVVGDYNDDLDVSITPGKPSPYQNFVDDTLDYFPPTKALSDAKIATTTGYPDAVDHHTVTNELKDGYVAGSAEAYRVDQYVASYDATTSDHYPVLTRYTWGGGGSTPTLTVTAPNGGESWLTGSSQSITWSASGVTHVKLEYTLDNGGSWALIASSVSASSGSYTWTVPSTTSTAARVRISDANNAALSDLSDGTFTITSSSGGPANVIINEILANEPGSDTAGEFVELVNVGGTAIDISGWTLSDGSSVRHTFASGTSLAAGKAIVVFGGAKAIPSGLTNAVAASTGTLSLANNGDSVTVKNSAGTTVNSYTYSSSLSGTDGVSMNRNPDTSATGGFVLHTALSSLSSSAGKRVSGSAF